MMVLGWQLDLMTLEVFSTLNDCMIPYDFPALRLFKDREVKEK